MEQAEFGHKSMFRLLGLVQTKSTKEGENKRPASNYFA
jgi:hypothetical protein